MKQLLFFLLFLLNIYLQGYSQPLVINWQKCYGGSQYEYGTSVIKTSSGFFLLCGTDSQDGDVPGTHGQTDYWLIKIDDSSYHDILWSKTYGGSLDDVNSQMKGTYDGGNILFGITGSND